MLGIQIYAPWCGHCQALEPTYNKLAKHLHGIESLVIAKMDGTTNEHHRAKVLPKSNLLAVWKCSIPRFLTEVIFLVLISICLTYHQFMLTYYSNCPLEWPCSPEKLYFMKETLFNPMHHVHIVIKHNANINL